MNANFKENIKKSLTFLKKRKYYLATSLCILTVGVIGFVSYRNAAKVWDDAKLPQSNALDALDASIPQDNVTDKEDSEAVSKPTKQPETPKAKEYILPVDGKTDVGYDAQKPVYSKTLRDWRIHTGIDYTAPLGTVVKAVNDGVVETVSKDTLMGVTVTVKHTDGYVSKYAGLAEDVPVKENQLVKLGDTVGKVGQTAIIEISQEPHLHFEVSLDGKAVDPLTLYDK